MTQYTRQGHAELASAPAGLGVGAVIGDRFRIDQLIGAGGMGIVAAATHLELGHRVAIKFLRDELAGNAALVERFIREARAVVALRTEHVCRVLDVARGASGAPFIVMEMLDGVDLARAIAAQPLHATVAVEYVMQACVALAEAHAAGVIHRDLKPANLFVVRRFDGGPLVKVLDFGIAKAIVDGDPGLTRSRVLLGSPSYMSPEQIDSPRGVDPRSDIWSLGVTLYELLSRRLPFSGASQPELAIAIAVAPPAPLEVDPRLRAVVMRCLEKSRDRRYASVAALAAELAPFGGPRAQLIAAQVAGAAGGPTQPSVMATPPPRVALDAATAATGAGLVLPTAASVVAAPIAPARRRRWPWLIVPVLGLAGLAWALRGAAEPARPAASVPAVTPDAAVAVMPDAAVADAAIPAPADASIAVAVEPAPGKPTRPRRPRPAIDVMAMMGGDYRAELENGCREMLKPEHADLVPAAMTVICACQLHDRAAAIKAFAKLSVAGDRDDMRGACEAFGVSLP